MSRKKKRDPAPLLQGLEVPLEELAAIIQRAEVGAISVQESAKLKALIETFALLRAELQSKKTSIERLKRMLFGAGTEKTREVLGEAPTRDTPPSIEEDSGVEEHPQGPDTAGQREGHGRNAAAAYTGARKVQIGHPSLHSGDACPGCQTGKVYPMSEPSKLVRVSAMAPLQATVYECARLRCGLCGEVYTAAAPEGVGEEKYDATGSAMVGLLRYGTGLPLNRIEKLQAGLGIPLPAATQWDLVKAAAETFSPVHEELIRQAAQGTVLHNDDTTMRILKLTREQRAAALGQDVADKRTGVFTSGIVAVGEAHKIALFFTGARHAGENLNEVLKRRAAELPAPIQMCDALNNNLTDEFETLLGKCILHARRNFVEVAGSFPEEVRFVLETLRTVYKTDALARKQGLNPEQRLQLHQEESGPLMKRLKEWMQAQFAERKVEPNSTLGDAIQYMTDHWEGLTLFLRVAGAPLDNNVCERALKKAILHRRNSLFYKTLNGARVGDIFMGLIYTAELNAVAPFEYLVSLLRHAKEVFESPGEWMPWNYQATLAALTAGPGPPASR
jgi:transposase